MKVVLVNTFDIYGGAARAVHRLNRGLLGLGCDSILYVAKRGSLDSTVVQFFPSRHPAARMSRRIRRGILAHRAGRQLEERPEGASYFSQERTEHAGAPLAALPSHDLVNLHWVADFLDYRWLPRLKARPLVWTLHDLNPFTGGCHYPGSCAGFTKQCGTCPQLSSLRPDDLSRSILETKQRALAKLAHTDLHIITPSRWLAGLVDKSPLLGRFPVTVVPNGIDEAVFAPRDRCAARQELGLQSPDRVLLFAAGSLQERRKGYSLLMEALAAMPSTRDLVCLSLGDERPTWLPAVRNVHLGRVASDDRIARAYSAADVTVIPSLEDNLPNTLLESLACGTPVVAFPTGGIPEVLQDGVTGFLASGWNPAALAAALARAVGDEERLLTMRDRCRRLILAHYTVRAQAERYLDIYRALLQCRQPLPPNSRP